jgi:hypothetical protein
MPDHDSTPLLVFAVCAFVWTWTCHIVDASKLGAKIPPTLRPKLAGIGGMLLGIAHVIAQGVDWRLAVVSGLMTSVAGMAGVSKTATTTAGHIVNRPASPTSRAS